MKYRILLLLLVPVMALAQQKQILAPKDFKNRLNDKVAVLIDVRSTDEFQQGHIEKAVNKNVFDKDFDAYCTKLEKDKTYYVYCLAGKRSHNAAETMRKKGLTVFELEGGIDSWNDAKLPLVK